MAKIKRRVAIQDDPCMIFFWADPGVAAQVFDIDGIVALHAGLVLGQWIAFYSPQYDRDDIEQEIREIVEIAPGEWEALGDVPAAGVEFEPAPSALPLSSRRMQADVVTMAAPPALIAFAKQIGLREPASQIWSEVRSGIDLAVQWRCVCVARGVVGFQMLQTAGVSIGQCFQCGRIYIGAVK